MKIIVSLVVAATLSYCSIASTDADTNTADNEPVSVLETATFANANFQEGAPTPAPVPQEPSVPPAPVPQEPVQAPVPQDVAPMEIAPPYQAPVIVDQSMMQMPAASNCCSSCCVTPCCCPPPPPINQTICLVDPCGCTYEASVCVPACCAGQQPRVAWRKGIFRRQIATVCWDCCGHQVKVVITGHGKVKVRG